MNSSTVFLLMQMNHDAPNFWREMCHANIITFTQAIISNYPTIDLKDIQIEKLQLALKDGI